MRLPGRQRRRVFHWLIVLLGLTTVLRLGFGWLFFGFATGDDVEILQAGFSSAFGLPYSPWSIRHLMNPELVVSLIVVLFRKIHRSATARVSFKSPAAIEIKVHSLSEIP